MAVVYKVISKTIINHLKSIFPSLISEEQSAFILVRHIVENIIVTFYIMHMVEGLALGEDFLMALNLDMSKAYDRVEWGFLRRMMLEMGFALTWV